MNAFLTTTVQQAAQDTAAHRLQEKARQTGVEIVTTLLYVQARSFQ